MTTLTTFWAETRIENGGEEGKEMTTVLTTLTTVIKKTIEGTEVITENGELPLLNGGVAQAKRA